MIIFPIHLGLHWTLVQALPKEKRLKYFDSMGSPNDAMLRVIKFLNIISTVNWRITKINIVCLVCHAIFSIGIQG